MDYHPVRQMKEMKGLSRLQEGQWQDGGLSPLKLTKPWLLPLDTPKGL